MKPPRTGLLVLLVGLFLPLTVLLPQSTARVPVVNQSGQMPQVNVKAVTKTIVDSLGSAGRNYVMSLWFAPDTTFWVIGYDERPYVRHMPRDGHIAGPELAVRTWLGAEFDVRLRLVSRVQEGTLFAEELPEGGFDLTCGGGSSHWPARTTLFVVADSDSVEPVRWVMEGSFRFVVDSMNLIHAFGTDSDEQTKVYRRFDGNLPGLPLVSKRTLWTDSAASDPVGARNRVPARYKWFGDVSSPGAMVWASPNRLLVASADDSVISLYLFDTHSLTFVDSAHVRYGSDETKLIRGSKMHEVLEIVPTGDGFWLFASALRMTDNDRLDPGLRGPADRVHAFRLDGALELLRPSAAETVQVRPLASAPAGSRYRSELHKDVLRNKSTYLAVDYVESLAVCVAAFGQDGNMYAETASKTHHVEGERGP